jgi:hypothetical protein
MTVDSIEKVALLIVGWLLGLLGPTIIEAIKRHRENKQVKVALAAELREVSYKLVLANHLIHLHFGTVDRPHLRWFKASTEHYEGPLLVEASRNALEIQLDLSDEQLSQYVRSQTAPAHQNINLQKIIVPLLDARVASLWYLKNQLQVLLLSIRSHINLLNELVDQSRYYAGLTFSNLKSANYDRAVGNLKDCQIQYAQRSKQIVDAISKLEQHL